MALSLQIRLSGGHFTRFWGQNNYPQWSGTRPALATSPSPSRRYHGTPVGHEVRGSDGLPAGWQAARELVLFLVLIPREAASQGKRRGFPGHDRVEKGGVYEGSDRVCWSATASTLRCRVWPCDGSRGGWHRPSMQCGLVITG